MSINEVIRSHKRTTGSGWVNAEEALPKMDAYHGESRMSTAVLVIDDRQECVAVLAWDKGDKTEVWLDTRAFDTLDDVTHWRPLPERPPEEEL